MKRLVAAVLALTFMSTLALASADPVADTRQIMAGTVTTAKVKNEYLSGVRDGTTAFQGALKAYRAVRAAEAPPAAPPVVTPPVVTPPAPPVPVVGYDPAPSLAGAAPIASGYDPLTLLQPSWGSGAIPASAGVDTMGAFRFILQEAGLSYDDAIVYPNQPGKSHLHQYYGHKCPANATYASLRAGAVPGAQNSDNPSCYWMPAMLDGIGNAVRPDFVSIYYKRRPKSDPVCSFAPGTPVTPVNLSDKPFAQGICVNLPNGLKFIFGYDMLTGQAPTGKLWYNCQGAGSTPGKYATLPEAAAKCPAGAQLGAIIEAPDCWDGKNLDSANHREHVAYAEYGTWGYLKCPSTHPYVIPTFTLGAWFTSDANVGNWRLSSDEMMPNLPRGTTFHADFFMAWDPTVKDMWHANCIDKKLNCSGGDLGNGLQMKNFSASPRNPNRLVPVASIPAT